ncbi:hypothetical protein GUITHDRAFT_111299 [Guillardia theta CCMP2712]|uniref:Uncharacterized protein n=2 Tax=Guillardia theta TaxID=55529 RepID=L1J266_GUITC|nr:hypothetical protein GUITHDRAFT_111299 [Guillardia theta CCMP2712]EKX42616.1 hypothetical protein GUITHDRAFT_111299 [Guillardia theta CCMP2712]|eukprot:XP_005829596.1 hypothetical protein GUITHDRAFT_111299 [Guillardia theta CCMP2712]
MFSDSPSARTPTIELSQQMAREYHQMSNDALLMYVAQGDHDAHRERLLREIMVVDNVTWKDAHKRLNEMEAASKRGMFIATVPFKTGIALGVVGSIAAVPLVFQLDTALWFNEYFVTADVAEPEDLETWLEVGAWTWNWMEPPIGQLSFLLLCLQFARNQMLNYGAKPYTARLKQYRAGRLCGLYPQYSRSIVSEFAMSCKWHD